MSYNLKTSSNFIALDRQEVLLEFEYNSMVYSSNDLYFLKVLNDYNSSVNFINFHEDFINRPSVITGNSLDRSVQQITESNWLKFDFEKPISHFEKFNPGLKFYNINTTQLEVETHVIYHTIKVHILQGYNFEGLEGIVLRASYKDSKSNNAYIANIGFSKDFDLERHATPFRLGDRVFDRFIKICVPDIDSLYQINGQIADSMKSYDYRYNMKNFPDPVYSRLVLEYFEIADQKMDSKGQNILTSVTLISDHNGNFKTEIETEDLFVGVAAVIRESGNGDFFELFPTYNGQFLEDYFAQRNRQFNNQFIVFNDIELHEHLFDFNKSQNYSEQITNRFTSMQETNFNDSFKYRPVITHPDTQAFTIDYTVRILDKTDNFYVVRRATYTFPDASKYGRYLTKINIDTQNPVKIVNKILKSENTFESKLENNPYLLSNSTDYYAGTISNNGMLPMQINKVFLEGKTYLVKEVTTPNNLIENQIIEDNINDFTLYTNSVAYGQGDCVIYLSEFDNFVKFSFYKLSNKNLIPFAGIAESKNSKYYFTFVLDDGKEVRISQNQTEVLGMTDNIDSNELLFQIDTVNARKMLSSTNRIFNITFEKSENNLKIFETVLYSGKIDRIENFTYSTDFSVNKILNI